jgi:hypothetical protein
LIEQQLETQELSGSFEVKGTALTGISLHQVSLSGTSLIKSAESNLVEVKWSLTSLIEKEIESLTVDKLHLFLDPAALQKKPNPEPEDQSDTTPLPEILDLVRGYVQSTEISLIDLKVEIPDVPPLTVRSFTHTADSEAYLLKDLKTRDHLERLIHNPSTTIIWNENGFEADTLTLRPDLFLENLVFHPDQKAATRLHLSGRTIQVTSDLKAAHQVKLLDSGLPLDAIAQHIGSDLPVSGMIDQLSIDTTSGLVDLEISDVVWEEYEVQNASVQARTPDLLSPFDQPVEISLSLDDLLAFDGTITPNKELLDSAADLSFELNWPDVPAVTGEVAFDSREVRLLAKSLDTLRLTARYQLDTQNYQAEALAQIKDASTITPPLAGALNFTAKARGNLESATHTGSLDLTRLSIQRPDFPEASATAVIKWDWPNQLSVEPLNVLSPEGVMNATLTWEDETLTIPQLEFIAEEQTLFSLTASLPVPLETRSLEEFLASDRPASLKISSRPLSFKAISKVVPLPEDLAGVFQADLTLAGSLAEPSLNGFASLDDFRVTSIKDLPPVEFDLKLATTEATLNVSAEAREPDGPLLELSGKLPFRPRAWIDRKTNPVDAPIAVTVKTPKIDLKRFQFLAPDIKQIDGFASINLDVSGTISSPKITGSAKAGVQRMRLENSPVNNFKNSSITANFTDHLVTIEPSTINASGGAVTLKGTIDLKDPDPTFDLGVSGKHFPLYRNPDFTFRGHPNLKLTGTLSEATISGTLQLAESLIYKDLEILPFGAPRPTEIPTPNLPSFVPRQMANAEVKPAESSGPMNWGLDILVTTLDPILIRGNLVEGEVTGKIKVGGTIGDPTTSGNLQTKEVVADLPFSELEVRTGVITLRPESLTNPIVNFRGQSKVGQYVIQVYLSGPVSNPKLVLSSDPPMPEGEIMLLLATGSASDQLADQKLASQKALQYLFEGLRRKNRGKDKSVLQRLIKNSDQIELSLGDTNRFSGRRFSSATLQITDQWDLTTQIDDQGQTRALVVFSVRLK